MKIGLMSDSHDKIVNIKNAIKIFEKHTVEYILHAGDLVSPFCLQYFKGFRNRFFLCAGNNLGDIAIIKRLIAEIGEYFDEVGEISLNEKKFALYHGTDLSKLDALLLSQKFDYVITGHTHHKEIRREGKTLLINPGETFGDLYGDATVAILDTSTNDVTFYDLESKHM